MLGKYLPENVKFSRGLFYIHTSRGLEYLDRAARFSGMRRVLDSGIAVFIASMAIAVGMLIAIAVSILDSPPEPTAAQDPVNLIAIPGVNEFLPLSATVYILIALFIAAGVHELAHGVAMRFEGVTVEETGIVLLGIFPFAAYVMPDEDEFEAISVRGKARVLAAGIYANLLVFIIVSVLFLLPGTGSPIDAFMTYFGAVLGGELPTGEAVASLSAITNVLFWTWFFNVNLAFVNVLPIAYLDGGQIVRLLAGVFSFPVSDPVAEWGLVLTTSAATLSVFVLAVFGPLLL